MFGIQRGAGADAAVEHATFMDEWLARALLYRPAQFQEIQFAQQFGNHYGKLVAAKPGNGQFGACDIAQAIGKHH